MLCLLVISCKNSTEETQDTEAVNEEATTEVKADSESSPKISLAQWSLHMRYQAPDGNPYNFARDAKELGFDAVEYVTQFYEDDVKELGIDAVVDSLINEQKKHGVSTVLVMVDHEGDLADPNLEKRNLAVENHKKWVDAVDKMGGHAIRVNTFGTNAPEIWIDVVQDGLRKLSQYAATKGINVLAENHGWLSSDAPLVMQAIKGVDMPNCGTLPDFGNWCVKRENEERWGKCVEEFPDYYKGLAMMMPAAMAVSAKAYEFDEDGNETKIDFYKMLQIVKDAGYEGYIGVEYESETLSEPDGIVATKNLINKAYAKAK